MDNEIYCNATSKTKDRYQACLFPSSASVQDSFRSLWKRPSSSCLPDLLSLKTAEEVNEKMNNLKVEEWVPVRNGTFEHKLDSETPQSVDWRKQGLVSPVQNQVGCFKLTSGDS